MMMTALNTLLLVLLLAVPYVAFIILFAYFIIGGLT